MQVGAGLASTWPGVLLVLCRIGKTLADDNKRVHSCTVCKLKSRIATDLYLDEIGILVA
jgi:hypothetical protein